MKVTGVRATAVNIPFTAPYVFSHGSVRSLTKTIVEVDTDTGVTGIGEVADGDRARDVEALGERVIGLDVRELSIAEQRCLPGIRYSPWADVQGMRRAFGGIEMALWDARGRIEGVPLHLLLGGAVRKDIELSEYFGYRVPGVSEPGESTPEEIAEYCARMIDEYGSTNFEGKVATVGLDEEVEMVARVRAAIGDRVLKLDANAGWTVQTAREAVRRLDEYVIHYYEDPVETYEEMSRLRNYTRANFSTHVINLEEAIRLKCPDTIVTNLVELGGIRKTVECVKACELFGIGFRFHSGETGVASTAYLHVSAALEHVREPSQTLFRWYGDDVIEEGTPIPRNGTVPVPDGPGLGVTLDCDALQRCHERFRDEGPFPKSSSGPRSFRTHFSRV